MGGFIGLDAEKVTNYEIGLRGGFSIFDRKATYEASLFRMKFRDKIIPRTVGFTTTFENAGETEHDGLELGLGLEVWSDLNFSLAYTLSDFEFTDGRFDGNELPGVPENQIFAAMEYEHEFPDNAGRIGASIEARWSDGYFVDDSNTEENASYTTLNLKLNYGWKALNTFFEVENLTYEEFNSFVAINGSGGQFFFPADERPFIGGVTFRF